MLLLFEKSQLWVFLLQLHSFLKEDQLKRNSRYILLQQYVKLSQQYFNGRFHVLAAWMDVESFSCIYLMKTCRSLNFIDVKTAARCGDVGRANQPPARSCRNRHATATTPPAAHTHKRRGDPFYLGCPHTNERPTEQNESHQQSNNVKSDEK